MNWLYRRLYSWFGWEWALDRITFVGYRRSTRGRRRNRDA